MNGEKDARAIDPQAVASARAHMLSGRSERFAKDILESLCDPTRLKIVRALQANTLAAGDIARVIERSPAATSQHLKVLKDVGAVVPTRKGNVVRYRLSDYITGEVLDDIAKAFDQLEEAV